STVARAAGIHHDKKQGQGSLFDELAERAEADQEKVVQLPEWPQSELLAAEKELLGFYVTGHPLTPFAPLLEKYCLHNSLTAVQVEPRTVTRIGGMIGALQQGISKKSGKPYALVTLEDLHGAVQLLCFNENFDKVREFLKVGNPILVIGEVNNDEDKPKIFPQEIMMLEDAPRKYTRQVHLRLHTAHLTPEKLEEARGLASSHPGKIPLFLCFRYPTGEAVFIETHEKFWVAPTRQLQQQADDIFGEETYYAKVDITMPEPQKRKWEKRNGDGGE
ncbi:MAG: OB-fold nucleic acid binding domain-containing protein, partial [Limisphaerales bacterium]